MQWQSFDIELNHTTDSERQLLSTLFTLILSQRYAQITREGLEGETGLSLADWKTEVDHLLYCFNGDAVSEFDPNVQPSLCKLHLDCWVKEEPSRRNSSLSMVQALAVAGTHGIFSDTLLFTVLTNMAEQRLDAEELGRLVTTTPSVDLGRRIEMAVNNAGTWALKVDGDYRLMHGEKIDIEEVAPAGVVKWRTVTV